MHNTALGTRSYSATQKFTPLYVSVGADVGQGRGVDRKHDILVLVKPTLFLLFSVNEEEAADQDWRCLCVTNLGI